MLLKIGIILYDPVWNIATCGPFCKDASHISYIFYLNNSVVRNYFYNINSIVNSCIRTKFAFRMEIVVSILLIQVTRYN